MIDKKNNSALPADIPDWQKELWKLNDESLAWRRANPRDSHPMPTGPVSMDQVLAFVKACQDQKEVWEAHKRLAVAMPEWDDWENYHPDGSSFENSDLERADRILLQLTDDFLRWYLLKNHPEGSDWPLFAGQLLIYEYLRGHVGDLDGEAARDFLRGEEVEE